MIIIAFCDDVAQTSIVHSVAGGDKRQFFSHKRERHKNSQDENVYRVLCFRDPKPELLR